MTAEEPVKLKGSSGPFRIGVDNTGRFSSCIPLDMKFYRTVYVSLNA